MPPGSTVVVTNPDEDCSADAFRAFPDELLAGPEPELDSLDAAEAARELRDTDDHRFAEAPTFPPQVTVLRLPV
ncbi:MAG: hypothetical protein ACYDH5_15880 [Acidimicrobiales bacterium]